MDRTRRIAFDLRAEPEDVDVDHALVAYRVVPDVLEQFLSSERPPGVHCQELEQGQFLGPKRYEVAIAADRVGATVQLYALAHPNPVVGEMPRSRSAAPSDREPAYDLHGV